MLGITNQVQFQLLSGNAAMGLFRGGFLGLNPQECVNKSPKLHKNMQKINGKLPQNPKPLQKFLLAVSLIAALWFAAA